MTVMFCSIKHVFILESEEFVKNKIFKKNAGLNNWKG